MAILCRRPQADLDNLKLAELPVPPGGGPALQARFQLEALLLTGQCIDPGARTREKARVRLRSAATAAPPIGRCRALSAAARHVHGTWLAPAESQEACRCFVVASAAPAPASFSLFPTALPHVRPARR